MADTTYIVLRREDKMTSATDQAGTLAWRIENSNVPAPSAEAAIRLACKTGDALAGTYVAVPARSWKPVNVQAVQTTVLKIEDAAALEHLTPG